MSDRIDVTSPGHALTLGRYYVDRDPLRVLEDMRANISYSPAFGYMICLGKDQGDYLYKRLIECIMFHKGQG